jgi:polysaccharide deacetylase family protein (PEP-CTERM system associated)
VEAYRVLSFDVEEHHRIEAAQGLTISRERAAEYARRMESTTRRLLDHLDRAEARATFFVVGAIARTAPALVREIHAAGHEVAAHGWDHTRVDRLTPDEFRDDARQCKDALEQVTGAAVLGYRAPTFSITRRTPWAVDVLAECGYEYDSSIFPVHHDRYGVSDAPRGPFQAGGREHDLLELPLLTYRITGFNLPVGGGGYFRLFPLGMVRRGIRQATQVDGPSVAMLYFHPWEFDEGQPRLPLGRLAKWRTYVGIGRTTRRLLALLDEYRFVRAIDAARGLAFSFAPLPRYQLAAAIEATAPPLRQAA